MEVLATLEQTFSTNLRELRGNRTQAEMAEYLSMPLRSYQNLESGGVVPQAETRRDLAKRLNISESALFFDKTLFPEIAKKEALVRAVLDLRSDEIDRVRVTVETVLKSRGGK